MLRQKAQIVAFVFRGNADSKAGKVCKFARRSFSFVIPVALVIVRVSILIRDTRKKTKPMAVAVIEQYNRAKKELEENTLTTKDVAERFNTTRQSVYRWVQAGLLKAHEGPPEIGQVFDPQEVAKFVPPPRGYRSHRKHASE